jgi:hypothetical protein
MIAAAIVACEAAFWMLVLGGLTARYVVRRRHLGATLLVLVPVVDLVLLAVTAVHLAGGAEADWTHGLAAVYLGFSVVLGPELIRSIDRRFAQRFDGAPRPVPARTPVAAEWSLWGRCVLACVIAAGLLGALILVAGPEQSRALWDNGGWFSQLGAVCVIWLLFGPLLTTASRRSSTIRP